MQRTATEVGDSTAAGVDVAPTASGLVVRDRNARERCEIGIDGAADLRSVSGSIVSRGFPFPIAAGVELRAGGLGLPDAPATIRDRDGGFVSRASEVAFREFPRERYLLELHGAVPCVVAFESGFTLAPDGRGIEFDDGTAVRLGARSARPEPSATVTTTDDPADLMAAISTFGSAVATRAPERSLPLFRGHPPALERGDELHVPVRVDTPDTEVTIQLPPERAYAYAAAPLATYLGATVEPSDRAQLVVAGEGYSLSGRSGIEESIGRVLKQTFTLDAVCRGAGPYPGESHERRVLDDAVELDWEALYDADPAERLAAYLSVPYPEVEPAVPQWETCAHLDPESRNLDAVPSLAAHLATIRSPPVVSSRQPGPTPWTDDDETEPIRPERSGAVEDAWFGDGTPLNASKGIARSYRNRFDRSPESTDVAVLAPEPDDADAAEAVAAGYDDPDVVVGLPRRELRRRLGSDAALVHVVGDVGAEGFACEDGWLDVREHELSVGADLFVMDSCSAHRQATELVENGALAGIAAFHESPGERADVGVRLARLLDDGFPLAGAVELASFAEFGEEGFLVVGDGASTLADTGSRPPVALIAETLADGYAVRSRGYATDTAGPGSRVRSPLDGDWSLTTARRRPETLGSADFDSLLDATDRPVVLDGEFVDESRRRRLRTVLEEK
jgi:hypothetical protein